MKQNLGRRLTRWWFRAPDGRTYQRRWADVLVAAAGLAVVAVSGVLVANRLVLVADMALFRGINHWPGWLYPPMWLASSWAPGNGNRELARLPTCGDRNHAP